MTNSAALADEVLTALSNFHQMRPITARVANFDLAAAYRVARAVTLRRMAHGERVVGRKIGFTNRAIWDEYGVHQPIWGPMYDTTVHEIVSPMEGVHVAAYIEPRIEPEIVLGLIASPEPDMDEMELMSCIGWVAHGFEIVQSLYPGWQFAGPDCVAAFGLHGALFMGPRVIVQPGDHAVWLERLQHFMLVLSQGGSRVDSGQAANVLGGPVSALRHLVEVLSLDPDSEPLRAGEIVTTGTITRAFPIKPGDRWSTSLTGIDLPGMEIGFV